MFKRLFFYCFYLGVFTFDVFPQTNIPNLIPPSPQSEQFKKFDEFKISPYNGLPDINIPLYSIKVRGIEIPLTLSYHASGIKYGQTSGEVGVGWNLNSSYRVSRTIFGRPDEHFILPSNFDSVGLGDPYERDHYLVHFIGDGAGQQLPFNDYLLDGQYDLFSYGTPKESGSFLISDRTNKTISSLEKSNSKFSYVNTQDSGILSLKVVDELGNIFDYGRDWATNRRVFENSAAAGIGYRAPTAWPIMKIKTAQGNDSISFKYYTAPVTPFNGQFIVLAKESAPYSQTDYESVSLPNTENLAYSTFFSDTIVTNYEIIYIIHRKDMSNLIDTIRVKSIGGKIIKQILFSYSSGGTHMFLDSLRIYGSSLSVSPQVYRLDYKRALPDHWRLAPDSWGYNMAVPDAQNYFHSNFQNDPFYIRPGTCGYPSNTYLSYVFTGGTFGDRDYYLGQDSYSLQKITYPTKGTSEYIYESNQYLNGLNAPIDGGGLRIQKIISRDPAHSSLIRTYKYGEGENGLGIPVIAGGMTYRHFKDTHAELVKVIAPFSACGPIGGSLESTIANQYTYSILPQGDVTTFINMASGNVRYSSVNEYISSVNEDKSGKTTYKYFIPNDEIQEGSMNTYGSVGYVGLFSPWSKPVITEKSQYSFIGNSYSLLKKETFEYENTLSTYLPGLKVERYAADLANGDYVNDPSPVWSYYTILNSWFKYMPFGISRGRRLLKEKHFSEYSNQSEIKVDELYEYNDFNQVSAIITTNSKGGTIREEFKYPMDYLGITAVDDISTGIKKLHTLNVVNQIVENAKFRLDHNGNNKRLISSIFNSFLPDKPYIKNQFSIKEPGTINDFVSSSVISGTIIKDSRFQTDFSIDTYASNGDIVQFHKENDINKSYLWSPKLIYPIAEAINAKSNEIYFDSFEDQNGWDGTLDVPQGVSSYDNTKAHSGEIAARIDNPGSGELVVHAQKVLSVSLAAPTKFHYSGWVYSNGPQAEIILFMKTATETNYYTYVDSKVVTATNKWIFIEGEYVVPANITQLNIRLDNNGGGSVWFDDIRICPSDAQMTTYTYDPLIGRTSQSDANNKAIYYEYDGFGRLVFIRDANGNILKKICYNFQGQVTDCDPPNIHVKWSYENIQGMILDGYYQEFADVYIRFYDRDGLPLTLTSSVDIFSNVNRWLLDGGGNITYTDTYEMNLTGVAGDSYILIAPAAMIRQHYIDGSNNITGLFYDSVIEFLPDKNYVIKP